MYFHFNKLEQTISTLKRLKTMENYANIFDSLNLTFT